ncbi:MAG: cysteine dioxygenase family protein [Alphaproteobacteria bacterium]|nr:cysteine dioxygenase family protein [Alphaproteobacteria bacterium]
MPDTAQSDHALAGFIGECRRIADSVHDAADIVGAIAPLMMRLVHGDRSFLRAEHFRSNPDHYTRNAIHISDDESLSLYALVWLPGQWTPVHDHGSWGVVGVVQGILEERSYMAADGEIRSDCGIRLKRGGVILLDHGSVTTFVPNPDHIHMTGVAADRERVVSLHLYGRNMNSFHVYDVAAGTRKLIDVPHQKS